MVILVSLVLRIRSTPDGRLNVTLPHAGSRLHEGARRCREIQRLPGPEKTNEIGSQHS